MSEEKEAFLSRWSRLKREQDAIEKKTEAPAPALPPVEELTTESDFAGFMHPKVKDELRRLALKKLFGDPHFKTPDPFEPYSIDLTGGESIPPEMLAQLNQARTVLFREEEEKKKAEESAGEDNDKGEAKPDEPGRQDA
jgi:Protein of unknown function (DUF3306)